MAEDPTKDERTQPIDNDRGGLYHVGLPGIEKDPLWVNYMETASQKAVGIMESGEARSKTVTQSERNLSILIKRLRKLHGDDQDDLLSAAGVELKRFAANPTIRDISDYVIADAQYNYSLNDPRFRPKDTGLVVARQISHYGTPREFEPTFDTPFQGQYEKNPYQAYAERARKCKDEYSDADGYMRAPLTKLVHDPAKGYVFEQDADSDSEELKLTHTNHSSWWHTDKKYFDPIWDHISDLYTDLGQLVKSDHSVNSKDAKVLLIAQIGWWFSQMMPYTRGSASIGIGLLQSLFDFSGIKNSPYKEGVAPDLEALVTPLPTYVENFSEFFVEKL